MSESRKKPLEPGVDRLAEHEKDKELAKAPKYTVRSAAEILKMNPEPPVEIWGGITLTNDIFEIIGSSGIGKSRIVLNLAVTQALAGIGGPDEFAGLPVCDKPLKWLLLGTENGLYRLYSDLSRMTQGLDADRIKVLGERIFLSTLEGEGDCYMAVDDEANVEKLRATIASVRPDVVVLDPWGDICGGSELDDNIVRETVSVLRRLRAESCVAMPIVIVNHARMGELENLKATGADAGNFGKNSKALFTISRAVWNLYFVNPKQPGGLIGMHNAKRSNGPVYAGRAVEFVPETMSYAFVPDFDAQAALSRLKADASTPRQNQKEVRTTMFEDTLENGRKAALRAVEKGPIRKTDLDMAIRRGGVAQNSVKFVIAELVKGGVLRLAQESCEHGCTLYGLPSQIEKLIAENPQNYKDKLIESQKKGSTRQS